MGDQQGTVRDIVNDSGVLRKHVDYDSFGKSHQATRDVSAVTPAVDQLFYYTGQERDATTGLQKHGARWYDPVIGRWLSEDPSGFDGGDPNLYRYVGNSPANAVDPTGLSQAGNPLTNLFGGYSGGMVSANKPINQFVGSTSVFASPTFNPYAGSLANGGSPIITQPRPASPGLSAGTLATVLGNSVYSAASNYLRTAGRAALSLGVSISTFGQAVGDQYITQFGGQSIPAQQKGDLPIRVQQAINQPDRYSVSSHQGQGYLILDSHTGSLISLNDAETLPTLTLMNRAKAELQAAKDSERLMRMAGEILISASPLHDAGRDVGVIGFGYDYYEQNRKIDLRDRQLATLGLVTPGGNSGQARYADELLDTLNEFRRYGIREVGPRLGQQQGRQFRIDQLELYEFDPNAPAMSAGGWQNQRRRIEQGTRVEPLTPPGYELSHGRATPAREGYDYTNSRLQGIDLNQLEESIRRQQGKP